jgi:hypothetical protein
LIYIEKDTTNKIVLTLTENSTLSNPNYLFVFENEWDTAEAPIEIYLPDTSTATDRYNLFTLVDGSGTGADLDLVKGQFTYTVYEAVGIPVTISDTTGDIVEEGRMVVSSATYAIDTIYD